VVTLWRAIKTLIASTYSNKRNIILVLTCCVLMSGGYRRVIAQGTDASTSASKSSGSLESYFPLRVGKFQLEKAKLSDGESESMKRLWTRLFSATNFRRAIYVSPDPKVETFSQAVDHALLLTVASFRTPRHATSRFTSLTDALKQRGYTLEETQLLRSGGRKIVATLASNAAADDWAVIWTKGSVMLQVQSSKDIEMALEFASSFPY
jgi:hypothetical protein